MPETLTLSGHNTAPEGPDQASARQGIARRGGAIVLIGSEMATGLPVFPGNVADAAKAIGRGVMAEPDPNPTTYQRRVAGEAAQAFVASQAEAHVVQAPIPQPNQIPGVTITMPQETRR